MSIIFDWAIFVLSPVHWPTVPRRAFVILLPVGVVYLVVGWLLLCAVCSVAAVAHVLAMAVGAPVLWGWRQVRGLWLGGSS